MSNTNQRTQQYDVAIIGGGIIGASIAYLLSHRRRNGNRLRVVLIEKTDDFAGGATRANSGIVHGAYAASHTSLKGQLMARGNILWRSWAERLSVPYSKTGGLVLAFTKAQEAVLEALEHNGSANTLDAQCMAEVITPGQLHTLQNGLSETVRAALHAPDVAILSPYEACIALGQDAGRRGVTLMMNRKVVSMETAGPDNMILQLENSGNSTDKLPDQELQANIVINAAGYGAAAVAALAGEAPFIPRYRRGQYILFQRGSAKNLRHVVFQAPGPEGKGILVTPTTWGNLMIGPNAEAIDDPEDTSTTTEGLQEILRKAFLSVPDLPVGRMMRDFAGIRPGIEGGDFYIDHSSRNAGLIHLGGIDSPGLTSAPAIAEMVVDKVLKITGGEITELVMEPRRWPTGPVDLQPMQKVASDTNLDEDDSQRIVCRCEQVRKETIDAACRAAKDAGLILRGRDSLKRRTRAGMGACQGQFCTPRVESILQKQFNISPEEQVPGRKPSPEFREFLRQMETGQKDHHDKE